MRRSLVLALYGVSALAASACRPDLAQTPPETVVTAVFDPLTSQIPLPNDLAFLNPPNTVCKDGNPADPKPACAQAELLSSFRGAFPSDQEVAITIDFSQIEFDAAHKQTVVAPDLDLSSFGPTTFFVFGSTPAGSGEIAMEKPVAADYVKHGDHGTLTLHHLGHAPWEEGAYAVFVRGGTSGIKTADGTPVYASQTFGFVAQGQNMTDPKNLGLLKAQTGSTEAALDAGKQLNGLITLYKVTAFPVVDTRFPHQELAVLTTFHVAPKVTNVTIDPARGLVPLPIDLLRDPKTGTLSLVAACTLAGSSIGADGKCQSAAAAGFQSLDGFSTTGAILAPTSELILSATANAQSVLLYDLSDAQHPVQVSANDLVIEPCEVTSEGDGGDCTSKTALSPVIAIQPAGATRGDLTSVGRTRPLKDNTDYAVVLTTAIHDKAGNSIGPGTVAKILGFSNAVSVDGHSVLSGIDDDTALALETMRKQLIPVFAQFEDRSKIAMAYTFHTQTILETAIQLAALPYQPALAGAALPIAASFHALTPTEAFTKYGVNPAVVPGSDTDDNIDEILEADIVTFDLLDPATGAFKADPTQLTPTPIHVLIATPKPTNPAIPDCQPPLQALGKCAPMMVFRHGFGRGRADMLLIADTAAKAGMVTVAIDAAKHGDRTLCISGVTGPKGGCAEGVTCMATLPPGAQGDAVPPGMCAGALSKKPVTDGTPSEDGIATSSGQYFVSINFFRTRDTLRQDLIDQSQLIHVLAAAPPANPADHVVFAHIFGRSLALTQNQHGLAIDPTHVYFAGQSLGAIAGAMSVAANPRISKAVLNVGGGTITDVFTTSEEFADQSKALLGGRSGADLLQFLVVAKTVLDPADPINFVGHLTGHTLPNLLLPPGDPNLGKPQPVKRVLAQFAHCDTVVPNPFSLLFASNIPVGPFPGQAGFGGPGTLQLFVPHAGDEARACTKDTTTGHGFLLNWSPLVPALAGKAQSDLTRFLTDDSFFPPGLQAP